MNYTIAAIPTVYRGRRYRSRLEARWAAFFDLLGWSHEYEPFDLGEWSPDFLLHTRSGVLTEIKPFSEDDPERNTVTEKMASSANASGWSGGILLLGASPWIWDTDDTVLGWLDVARAGSFGEFEGAAFCMPPNRSPQFDFCRHNDRIGCVSDHLCERDDRGFLCRGRSSRTISLGFDQDGPGNEIMRLWAVAGNTVQWIARARS